MEITVHVITNGFLVTVLTADTDPVLTSYADLTSAMTAVTTALTPAPASTDAAASSTSGS